MMHSETKDTPAPHEYRETDPIDRAIDAFHEAHPLAGNDPLDWPAHVIDSVRTALRAAIAILAPTPQTDAAPIINGHAINDLFLKWSEWTTELGEAISRKNIDGFVSELRAAIAAGGAQEAVAPESAMAQELEWHWSTSDEGPMYPAGTDDVAKALSHALYESGITTFGEDQTTIFLCRFRPLNIDWKHHADWLLEHIDDTVIDYVAEGDIPTDQTDADALASAMASIVKVNASAAYDNRQYSPGDSEYETALSRVRNDDAAAPASNGEQA